MNRKAFGILVLTGCLLVMLAIVGQNRDATGPIAGESAGTQILAGLADNLNSIIGVTITGAGAQQLVGLQRVEGQWTVSEAGGYAADQSKVNALLIALAEARIVEEKTSNPELHSRLGVEDIAQTDATGFEVSLINASGESYEVVLGDTYTSSQVYARVADDDQSVLIDRNPDVARDPSDWVVADIISIVSDRVQRVEITQANGARLTIRKEAPGNSNFTVDGIPDGRELQYAGVANVSAELLQNLRLDDVRPATDEPVAAAVVSEYWMFDGLVITVTTTGVDDDNGDGAWLKFTARYDTDQALSFAAAVPAEDSDPESPAESALAEADAINDRLADWQYRIPSYQLSQLTRRIEDLLTPQAAE